MLATEQSRPDLACCIVNDWLPCIWSNWVETITPEGNATLVCSY